jgi:hypothetical protein
LPDPALIDAPADAADGAAAPAGPPPDAADGFAPPDPGPVAAAAPPPADDPPALAPPEDAPPRAAPAGLPAEFPVAAPLPPVAQLLPPTPHPSPLEERLLRLEAELARLRAPGPAPAPNAASVAAAPSVQKSSSFFSMLGKRLFTTSGPAPGLKPAAEPAPSLVPAGVRRTWVLLDALAELRAILRMFVDPRYHMSLFGWLTPLVLAVAILTSGWWLPLAAVPGVGWLLDKIVDLFLAFVLFKVLGHEARRYRETAPDLPPHLRL